jgi:hypothetical protein
MVRKISKDAFWVVLIAVFILLSSPGFSGADARSTLIPPPPQQVVLQNIGALPLLMPTFPSGKAPESGGLPPVRPIGIEWLLSSDIAMRSA